MRHDFMLGINNVDTLARTDLYVSNQLPNGLQTHLSDEHPVSQTGTCMQQRHGDSDLS